jgi:hypothetical protein
MQASSSTGQGQPTHRESRRPQDERVEQLTFNELFDHAVTACAEAQRLSALSSDSVKRARLEYAPARRMRALVAETRDTWEGANAMYAVMRIQVERVAGEMREAGVDNRSAGVTIRQHIRFVLYDEGLTERDTEPVVARASTWVDMVFAAA